VQSPVFTFQDPGVYDVSLTVSGPDGADSHIEYGYIEVQPGHSLTQRATSP